MTERKRERERERERAKKKIWQVEKCVGMHIVKTEDSLKFMKIFNILNMILKMTNDGRQRAAKSFGQFLYKIEPYLQNLI